MNFEEAYTLMKQGMKVRLPTWSSSVYWAWEEETIMMHLSDESVVDIMDSICPEITFDDMVSNDFEIVEEEKKEIFMSFGDALKLVRKGMGMRLPTWNEDVTIYAQIPDAHSKMTAPYLYVNSRYGNVPWIPTQIEIFSENWMVTV